jgi:hypothetical protein
MSAVAPARPAQAGPVDQVLVRTLEAELAGGLEELRALEAGLARVARRRWWDRAWARFVAGVLLWGVGSAVSGALTYGVAALSRIWF